MEILTTLGITEKDVRAIAPNVADSIEELASLSTYAAQEDAPRNIVEAYKSLNNEVVRYLQSTEFKEAANKAGVAMKSGMDIEERVVVADIPKVNAISERIAERRAGKKKATVEAVEIEEVEKPTVEAVDVEEVEEIEEPKTEVEETEEQEVETKIEEVEESTIELFGFAVKGEKGGELTGRDLFSTLLSYGQSDYVLEMFEDSNGYHYRLNLPLSMGQAVFSFRRASDKMNLTSILDVWKTYAEDNSAVLNLVSRSEDQLEQLSDVLGYSTVTKDRLPLSATELKDEKFAESSYHTVNDSYSRSISGDVYYNVAKLIKIGWETSTPFVLEDAALVYGIDFGDYVYKDAERTYSKGGYSIVTKKLTFYVPKGLTKDNVFAETGGHLKETQIKTSKFTKDIGIGKRFQVATGDFDTALSCRIVGSNTLPNGDDLIYVADESGKGYKISRKAYNYFKHYYGSNIQLKLSKDTVIVVNENGVVGLISATKFGSYMFSGMYDYDTFRTELRTLNIDAFDSMVSEKVAIEKEVEVEIEEIKEKEVEGVADGDLKEELWMQIDTLYEMYEEEVEEGDNQDLIDELSMQLDTLSDMLIEHIEELMESDGADKEKLKTEMDKADKIQKALG